MRVSSSFGAAIATAQSYLPSIASTTKYGSQVAVGLTSAFTRGQPSYFWEAVSSIAFFRVSQTFARDAYNAPTLKARVGNTIVAMGSAAIAAYSLYSLITNLQLDGARISKCDILLGEAEQVFRCADVNDPSRFYYMLKEINEVHRDFIENHCYRLTDGNFPALADLIKL